MCYNYNRHEGGDGAEPFSSHSRLFQAQAKPKGWDGNRSGRSLGGAGQQSPERGNKERSLHFGSRRRFHFHELRKASPSPHQAGQSALHSRVLVLVVCWSVAVAGHVREGLCETHVPVMR